VHEGIPLLEFDSERTAVLEPGHGLFGSTGTLPERAVLCFYAEILATLPADARQIGQLEAVHGTHPVWCLRRGGEDIAVLHPGMGAPLAAFFLECAIAMGARKVVACGGCASLTDVGAGEIVVPDAAVRDEGTSYHYLPASREVAADAVGVRTAEAVLTERGVVHRRGKVWTTDGLFRETRSRIARRREEGCLVVDMEAAAFFAVARFRGIRFAQLLYGGDDIGGPEWEHRDWTTSPSRALTFDLALEVASRL